MAAWRRRTRSGGSWPGTACASTSTCGPSACTCGRRRPRRRTDRCTTRTWRRCAPGTPRSLPGFTPRPSGGVSAWDERIAELGSRYRSAVLSFVSPDGFPFAVRVPVAIDAAARWIRIEGEPAGIPFAPGLACLTAHEHAPEFSWQRNFQVRGDLVFVDGGWALVPHRLVGGFELPRTRAGIIRANAAQGVAVSPHCQARARPAAGIAVGPAKVVQLVEAYIASFSARSATTTTCTTSHANTLQATVERSPCQDMINVPRLRREEASVPQQLSTSPPEADADRGPGRPTARARGLLRHRHATSAPRRSSPFGREALDR